MRTGSWWGSHSWHLGPVKVSTFRVPKGLGRWGYRLVVEAPRFHALVTVGGR